VRIRKRTFFFVALWVFLMFSLGGFEQFFSVILTQGYLLNIALIVFFVYVNIYIHEFGHLIAARAVGIEVKRVVIGTGREIARWSVLGVPLVITNNMGGGQTFPGHIGRRLPRLRFFVFAAGGILLQLCVAVLLIHYLARQDASYHVLTGSASVVYAFVTSSVVLMAFNLLPVHYRMRGIRMPSDGLRMLRAPFMKEKDLGEILSAGRVMEAHELFEKGQYEASAEAYEGILKDYPRLTLARNNLAVACIKLLAFDRAMDILAAELGAEKDRRYDLLIHNNLAWVNLLLGTEDSLAKADEHSRTAFKLSPDVRNIRGTRGSVLIALGKYDEGIKLLKKLAKLRKPVEKSTNNACAFLFLSYAYFMQGDRGKANQYLAHAERYLSRCEPDEKYLHEILRKKMAGLGTSLASGAGAHMTSPLAGPARGHHIPAAFPRRA